VKYHNNTFIRCNFFNGGAVISFASSFFNGAGDGSFDGSVGTDYPNGGECLNNVFVDCGDMTGGNTNITGWYTFTTDLTNVIADYNFVSKSNRGVTTNALHQAVGDPGGWSLNGPAPSTAFTGEFARASTPCSRHDFHNAASRSKRVMLAAAGLISVEISVPSAKILPLAILGALEINL